MNFVFLSPHFPPNYYRLCAALNDHGVRVLGIGDGEYRFLRPELKESLTEYYKVDDMEEYEELLKACGYFVHKFGKIDRIESLNEHWLEKEAWLRTDFNIPGIKEDRIRMIKNKSMMKQVYVNAGIPVAGGRVVHNIDQAMFFISEFGYPVIAKPDKGVGATDTFKLHNDGEVFEFFSHNHFNEYIFEEFISGRIESFDGLVDKYGNPVFLTSHRYCDNVMELVNDQMHTMYYSVRYIPEDLFELGLRTLKAFDVRERFFHFEYFRTDDNRLVALEVNMRPPGGLTMDMFNYSCDFDIYRRWADLIANNRFNQDWERKYFCGYVGRRNRLHYKNTVDDVIRRYQKYIPMHSEINSIFRVAIGDYGFIVRSEYEGDLFEIKDFIHDHY